MKFPSKKDLWLGILILSAMLFPAIYFAVQSLWIGVLVMTPVLLFMGWFWYGTYYILEDKSLIIRSGPLRQEIYLDDIKRIRGIRSILSSPALSLDRLEIIYETGKTVLISPRDKELFLEIIRKRCQWVRE